MLYFLLTLDNYSALEIMAVCVAYFVAICIAMSFHEYSHSLAAYKCGDSTPRATGRLTLNPFAHFSGLGLISFFLVGFGWAKPVKINPLQFRNYRKGLIWVSISGVLANLVLAFIFSGLFFFLGGIILTELLATGSLLFFFLYYLIYFCLVLNLVLFLFNLLPIYPLDGFNFISIFTKYNNKFIQFVTQYGFLIILLIIIPVFNGSSLLSLFYNEAMPWIISIFNLFWGIFV